VQNTSVVLWWQEGYKLITDIDEFIWLSEAQQKEQ
jgi:hypothetical protein